MPLLYRLKSHHFTRLYSTRILPKLRNNQPFPLSTSTSSSTNKSARATTSWTSTLRIFSLTLLYLLAPSLYLTRNHYAIYSITGSSMSPTLSPHANDRGTGDWVLFRKRIILPGQAESLEKKRAAQKPADTKSESEDLATTPEGWTDAAEVKRGSIVSFYTPHSPDKIAVKRVIALPGDVVTPLVKPTSAPLSPSLPTPASAKSGECPRELYKPPLEVAAEKEAQIEPITVPFGHVWVEGDNPYRTWDSNDYGPLSSSLITGVAKAVVLPWDRRGVPVPEGVEGRRQWEEDGWRERVNGRVKWKEEGRGIEVPEEWVMH